MIHRQNPSKMFERAAKTAAIGLDPDLHHCPVAVAIYCPPENCPQHTTDLASIHLARVKDSYKGLEAARLCGKFARNLIEDTIVKLHERGVEQFVVVVEAQAVQKGRTKNPEDIINLAHMAGGARSYDVLVRGHCPVIDLCPQASAWKGEQPKDVNQGRTWLRLGVKCRTAGGKDPYAVPLRESICARFPWLNYDQFFQTDWKHVGDSVGLALWGLATTLPGLGGPR